MEHSPAGNGTTRIGPPHGYLPIEEHGIVGDLRTVALIGTDGTVDWYCPARFDAPSLFGALLDKNKGGYFSITARTSYAKPKQLYLPDTNILLTRFQGKDAVGHRLCTYDQVCRVENIECRCNLLCCKCWVARDKNSAQLE